VATNIKEKKKRVNRLCTWCSHPQRKKKIEACKVAHLVTHSKLEREELREELKEEVKRRSKEESDECVDPDCEF